LRHISVSFHPAIDWLAICAIKPDFLAGLDEPANRFQAQLLWFVHADVQSPACLTLQTHLVLESTPLFKLILNWKECEAEQRGESGYDFRKLTGHEMKRVKIILRFCSGIRATAPTRRAGKVALSQGKSRRSGMLGVNPFGFRLNAIRGEKEN
jgi:hypothetical protein